MESPTMSRCRIQVQWGGGGRADLVSHITFISFYIAYRGVVSLKLRSYTLPHERHSNERYGMGKMSRKMVGWASYTMLFCPCPKKKRKNPKNYRNPFTPRKHPITVNFDLFLFAHSRFLCYTSTADQLHVHVSACFFGVMKQDVCEDAENSILDEHLIRDTNRTGG